jgi:hypothetical protein
MQNVSVHRFYRTGLGSLIKLPVAILKSKVHAQQCLGLSWYITYIY